MNYDVLRGIPAGQTLNLEIAKMTGWRFERLPSLSGSVTCYAVFEPNGEPCLRYGEPNAIKTNQWHEFDLQDVMPDYSGDLNVAWSLIPMNENIQVDVFMNGLTQLVTPIGAFRAWPEPEDENPRAAALARAVLKWKQAT